MCLILRRMYWWQSIELLWHIWFLCHASSYMIVQGVWHAYIEPQSLYMLQYALSNEWFTLGAQQVVLAVLRQ